MKMQTQHLIDMDGYPNIAQLQASYENKCRLENEICICSHPRYMHAKMENGSTFCRVHGCKEPNNHLTSCLKFKKDKGLHQETL